VADRRTGEEAALHAIDPYLTHRPLDPGHRCVAGVHSDTGDGRAIERPLDDNVMLSLPTLTTESRLWELIAPLAVGEAHSLARLSVELGETIELSDTSLDVLRLDDLVLTIGESQRSARAYSLSSRADDGSGSVESKLWLDAETGRPLGLEQAEQLGNIVALQVE
jgi:hypothetical protein